MKTTNSGRVDQWSHCVESRYRKVILAFPSHPMTAASLHTVGKQDAVRPCLWRKGGGKPFVQGGSLEKQA